MANSNWVSGSLVWNCIEHEISPTTPSLYPTRLVRGIGDYNHLLHVSNFQKYIPIQRYRLNWFVQVGEVKMNLVAVVSSQREKERNCSQLNATVPFLLVILFNLKSVWFTWYSVIFVLVFFFLIKKSVIFYFFVNINNACNLFLHF